jgi:serine/threonine-protein kinase
MGYDMITEAMRSDWTGRVVDGRFTLLQWLGGSELGVVFLTEVPGEGSRKAAIKMIPADADDAEARFAGWAAAATLSHPHLMRIYHCGRCQIGAVPLIYAVMEYADEILSQILLERPLTPAEAAEMLDPVLDTLAYLHGKGFVHGCIRPSEIMAVDDQLKLSCDNIQRADEPGKRILASGIHVAPEAASGKISPAADLWSLGVTLVEALTQHPPVWERSAHGEPTVPWSVPQPFAGIARECLRLSPESRCSIGDVKARLEAARTGKTERTALAKLRWPAIVAVALILLVVVAVMLLRSRPSDEPSQSAADVQPAPAMTAPPPASPASETHSSSTAMTALPPPSPVPETRSAQAAMVKGDVVERVQPDVPEKVRATIHGKVPVSIRVKVDPDGKVSNAAVDSQGPSKYFAKAALQAAQQWRFKPAQVDGKAVSSEWVLRFVFGQTATEITPVRTSP